MIENLANIEAMLVGMLLILLFVTLTFLLIIIYLSNRDKRFIMPIIRPSADEQFIKGAIETISQNKNAYKEKLIQILEDQNSSPLIETSSNLAILPLKNYGNSAAIDIELNKMAGYYPSDGMENRLFSLSSHQSTFLFLALPNELVNHLGISKIKIKYKNVHGSRCISKFSYTISKGLSVQIDEKTTIHVIVQV